MEKADTVGDGQRKAVAGALIGVDLIAVFQLLTLPILDKRLTVALYCFAISIPSLAMYLRSVIAQSTCPYNILVWHVPLGGILGLTISVVGLGAVFFHLGIVAGCLFSVFAILGFLASNRYRQIIKQVNESLE